jgi:hypothetical protein
MVADNISLTLSLLNRITVFCVDVLLCVALCLFVFEFINYLGELIESRCRYHVFGFPLINSDNMSPAGRNCEMAATEVERR